eukprot:11215545-Lingulodinium_polyedra.AAC.1
MSRSFSLLPIIVLSACSLFSRVPACPPCPFGFLCTGSPSLWSFIRAPPTFQPSMSVHSFRQSHHLSSAHAPPQ